MYLDQRTLFCVEVDDDRQSFVVRLTVDTTNWRVMPTDLAKAIDLAIREYEDRGYTQS